MLEGFRRILENDFEIVGSVEDGRSLLEAVEQRRPEIVLLDISMPMLNGLDAARQIKKDHPKTKLVFVTMHPDMDYVREAFRAGASGYVLKRGAVTELVKALNEVLNGRFYLTPLVTREAIEDLLNAPAHGLGKELTPRQREVLQLVAEGRTAKEIACLLNISVKTVDFHKASIMQSLQLRSTAELTRYALDRGLIPKGNPIS